MLFAGREHSAVLGREQNSLKTMHYPAQWALIYFFIYLFISTVSIHLWVWRVGIGTGCLRFGWLWGREDECFNEFSFAPGESGQTEDLMARERGCWSGRSFLWSERHASGDPHPGLLLSPREPLPQKPCFPPCSRAFWNVSAVLLLSFPGLYVGVTCYTALAL